MAFSNNRGRQANKPLDIARSDLFMGMRDVVFIDNSTSSESDSEMHTSERNETSMVVGVVEFFKSPLIEFGEDIEEREKQCCISRIKRTNCKQRGFLNTSSTQQW